MLTPTGRFEFTIVWAVFVTAWSAAGQPPDESVASEETVAATEESQEARRPPILNLRYDEHYGYLDDPATSYQADFCDPIKNIHLDDNWRLDVGGEFRFRLESETNKAFGANRRTNDTFQLYRSLLHLNVRYQDSLRFFVQGIHAFDEQRSLPDRATDENRWDLHQAFVDVALVEACDLTLRIGRQELHYGSIRWVTSAEWDNVRQRFDAAKLFSRGDTWDVDLWYAKPVVTKRLQGDDWDNDVDFYGAYVTYKGIPRHGLDFFCLAIDDTGNRVNPNGRAGDRNIYTLGSLFSGQTGSLDYAAELAGQWGRWAGHTVQGWAWNIEGGYTFDCPWTPRLGAGVEWYSGDGDPTDSKIGTFDQLFGDGHAHLGYLDLFGRQNVTAARVDMTVEPLPDEVEARLAYYAFWLESNEDGLYDPGGGVTRRDPMGRSGTEIGHEIDLTVNWNLDRHSSLLAGWSHFFDDTFIRKTGPSKDPDLLYIQYAFRF